MKALEGKGLPSSQSICSRLGILGPEAVQSPAEGCSGGRETSRVSAKGLGAAQAHSLLSSQQLLPNTEAVQSRGFKMQVETLPLKSRAEVFQQSGRLRLEFSTLWEGPCRIQ